MTQFIRAAQAFAATTSYLAQGLSPGATDLRDFHFRVAQTLTFGKGTTKLGTIKSLNTTDRYLAIQDDVWAAVTGAGVNVADLQYNSATDPGVGNTSEIMTAFNPGTHRQVIVCVGDSITNMSIGANALKKFNYAQYRTWAQGMGACPGGITYLAPSALPSTASQPLEVCYHNRSAHEKSRIKYNAGHDSWRLLNQPGMNYQTPTALTGAPHTDNMQQNWKLVIAAGQQLRFQIWAVSNDIEYALRNSNGGMTAATYVQNLTDYITAMKVVHPTAFFDFIVPIARASSVNSTTLNGTFDTIATLVIANKATIGITNVLDTRQISVVDCRVAANYANATYYQEAPNGVHPTPALVALLDPYFEALYDKGLGFTPNPTYAGALA